jgi:hypothetical protein
MSERGPDRNRRGRPDSMKDGGARWLCFPALQGDTGIVVLDPPSQEAEATACWPTFRRDWVASSRERAEPTSAALVR